MSTRGHSHMRGLVPQDGLFGGSGAAGLVNERGSPGEGLLIVPPADSLLTLPSPLGAHQRTISGGCGPRSTALLRRARRRSTWSTRSAASMNDVDRRCASGEPVAGEGAGVTFETVDFDALRFNAEGHAMFGAPLTTAIARTRLGIDHATA